MRADGRAPDEPGAVGTSRRAPSLGRVWTIAVLVFVLAAATSRALVFRPPSALPAYLVGVGGVSAIGAALAISWRRLGAAGGRPTARRRALRALVALGGVLCVLAVLFPFV